MTLLEKHLDFFERLLKSADDSQLALLVEYCQDPWISLPPEQKAQLKTRENARRQAFF